MPSPSPAQMRRTYAGEMLRIARIESDPGLLEAFATVPREAFLGPPPWTLHGAGETSEQSSSDVAAVHRDVLVALDAAKGVNNGSPSLHALGLHALSPRPGDRVVHIGAGTGYYSAILAELVGPAGHVVAVEFDPAMAARARECLKPHGNVEPVTGNGADWPQAPADIVYVNFAVDRPADRWIEMLRPGGRLLFPLGVPGAVTRPSGPTYSARGGYLLITRTPDGFAARFLHVVSFIWSEAIPTADADSHARLAAGLSRGGGATSVRSLRWKTAPKPGEWYSQPDWGLSADPPSKPD